MQNGERLTLNVLLSLIIQAKRQGKGKLGNGRLLVLMLRVIADRTDGQSRERSVLSCFCGEPVKSYAYQKIDKQLGKFFKSGSPYPYEKLHFSAFAAAYSDPKMYLPYFLEMCAVYDQIVAPEHSEQLIFTLLELLRRDPSIEWVLYGTRYIRKEMLLGDAAHKKRICAPALIFGLLCDLHKKPDFAPAVTLAELPVIPGFYLTANDASCPDSAAFAELLNPEIPLPLAQNLFDNARRIYAAEAPDSPTNALAFRATERGESTFPENGNLFLYGADGTGKSAFLRTAFRGKNALDLSLSAYRPSDSAYAHAGLLLMLLLRFQYCGKYSRYEAMNAAEGEETVLRQIAELDAAMSQTACVFILDDWETVPSEYAAELLDEIANYTEKWHSVRWILCGSAMPKCVQLQRFTPVECVGFSDGALSEILPPNTPEHLRELLRIPLLCSIYQQNEAQSDEPQNRAELLDSYFSLHGKKHPDPAAEMMRQFLLRFALPYAAFEALHGGRSVFSRADLSAAIGKAISFYLKNDRVYQNYSAARGVQKHLLPDGSRQDEWLAVAAHFSFLQAGDFACDLRFSHRVYQEYFAAKHVINAAEALDSAYTRDCKRLEREFARLALGKLWFPEEMTGAYAMIGELAGDDKNRPCADFCRIRTVLDNMLDWAREIKTFRLTENVMRTMAAVRGNIICEADFRDLSLPMWIPAQWKFSLNGEFPSLFSGCKTGMIGLIDGDISPRVSPEHTRILYCFSDGYSALYDTESRSVTAEYIGEIPAFAAEWETVPCDEEMLIKIYSVLPQFRGCDFSGAHIFTDQAKRLLPVLCRSAH